MGSKRKKPKIKNVPKTDGISSNKVDSVSYPLFCFKYLQKRSIKGSKDADFFVDFLLRLQDLSVLGWEGIRTTEKHGLGTEKIPIGKLIPKKYPPIVTPEVTSLTVFRANGDNRPFLGIRENDIFHVIYIETRFGDIYKHE